MQPPVRSKMQRTKNAPCVLGRRTIGRITSRVISGHKRCFSSWDRSILLERCSFSHQRFWDRWGLRCRLSLLFATLAWGATLATSTTTTSIAPVSTTSTSTAASTTAAVLSITTFVAAGAWDLLETVVTVSSCWSSLE